MFPMVSPGGGCSPGGGGGCSPGSPGIRSPGGADDSADGAKYAGGAASAVGAADFTALFVANAAGVALLALLALHTPQFPSHNPQ